MAFFDSMPIESSNSRFLSKWAIAQPGARKMLV